MDQWINGWTNGPMDQCTNEWMNGWMDEWVNGWKHGPLDVWMDEWMDQWSDTLANTIHPSTHGSISSMGRYIDHGWMGGSWMDRSIDRCIDRSMDYWWIHWSIHSSVDPFIHSFIHGASHKRDKIATTWSETHKDIEKTPAATGRTSNSGNNWLFFLFVPFVSDPPPLLTNIH